MEKEIYSPGDIILDNCKLINYRGNYVEIRDLVIEFNVYTDIFSSGITCNIVIGDAIGLIEKVPLVGDEMLYLTFKTPTMKKKVNYILQVYKIGDRVHNNDRLDTYVIHGCSPEMINDARREVSIVYNNVNAGDIVTKVYNEYLKPSNSEFQGLIKKTVDVDETLGEHHFVGAYKRPFKAINYIAREAMAKVGIPSSYLFYEDEESWNFKDLNKMLEQNSVERFYYAQTDIQLKEKESIGKITIYPYQKISEIQYPKTKDIIYSMETGYYDNELNFIDLIRKQYNETTFKTNDSFSQFNHLGKGKYFSDKSIMNNNTGSSSSVYFPTEIGEDYRNLPYISKGVNNDSFVKNPRKLQNFYSHKLSSFSSIDNIAVNVTIPGNTDLRIGQVVDIFVQQNAINEEDRMKSNLLFGTNESARFLITAIRHLFNKEQNSFHTIIRCAKDTYAKSPVEIT